MKIQKCSIVRIKSKLLTFLKERRNKLVLTPVPSFHFAEVEGHRSVRESFLVEVLGVSPDKRRHVVS